jgi:hypothetical protein
MHARCLYMSKQIQDNFIEKTRAYKTIQARKEAAAEAGIVLEYSKDSEDFPNTEMNQLERLKELSAKGNGKMDIVVTRMSRQSVRSVDEKGKPVTKEYLTYGGEVRITTYDGVPYSQEFEVGRYSKPNVVSNPDQIYDQRTRQPLKPEKILSGRKMIFDLGITDKNRKKTVDEIIGIGENNYAENISFYYNELGAGNYEQKSDNTFSYDDFVNCSIAELRNMSSKGGGSRSPGYWRDREGKLHTRGG